MDLLAKLYWQEQFGAPVANILLGHEFWTFHIHGEKVPSYLDKQIRNHVSNGGAQCERWKQKGQLPPETFTTMHWDACKQAKPCGRSLKDVSIGLPSMSLVMQGLA